jgi:uncharacterized protein YndB with AHSA1/START domain
MTRRPVAHDTFALQRDYPAAASEVFGAFADLATKKRWFAAPEDWVAADAHTLEFRVGGREHESGGPSGGPSHRFDAIYHDIVPNERIIYSYTMTLDDRMISVSLTTIEIFSRPDGSRLRLTEHGAYFDGADSSTVRREGTEELLDALGRFLSTQRDHQA